MQIPYDEQPICEKVLRSNEFATFFDLYYNEIASADDEPPAQIRTLKLAIRAAARKARDLVAAKCDAAKSIRSDLLYTLARVIWRRDVKLASTLVAASELASILIQVINYTKINHAVVAMLRPAHSKLTKTNPSKDP